MSDPIRCWMIKRNCSASPRQVAWAFASIVAVSFACGASFAARGLWLALPFLDVETLAAGRERVEAGPHLPDGRRARLAEELKVALQRAMPA